MDTAATADPDDRAPGLRAPTRARYLGIAANAVLRLSIAYFLAEVLIHPDDPRFAGKAIPVRNLVVVGGLSLLFPALHFLLRRWRSYPVWSDNLYLSIFWLDMAGNSFDLYDRFYYFDLLPHFHGPGAFAAAVQCAFGLPALSALGVANAVHVLLEGQEYYTDVFFGTHNVRGVSDTVNDLLAGLAGTAVYTWLTVRLRRRRAPPDAHQVVERSARPGGRAPLHPVDDPARPDGRGDVAAKSSQVARMTRAAPVPRRAVRGSRSS